MAVHAAALVPIVILREARRDVVVTPRRSSCRFGVLSNTPIFKPFALDIPSNVKIAFDTNVVTFVAHVENAGCFEVSACFDGEKASNIKQLVRETLELEVTRKTNQAA
ncbi:hypothetical protein F441_14097 [Phytophthora nicotianae CJ01A1]|uniref:Uncharacterized protein n=2 Tax=Phytophthora nicotianae TaxID=4792 RepID=W2WI30_PHYNI|nr:hypothetical protein F444_14220 [Phytophthora nicotianae P1976]ETP10215.1 hypothetical protein F441_14097 [Phytophthora nicotianae CJ01A1]